MRENDRKTTSPSPVSSPLVFSLALVTLIILWVAAVPGKAQTESLWQKILRIAGISATPSTLRGPGDEIETGDIWMVNLASQTSRRLTRDGSYRSPVFVPGDEAILGLTADDIVRIALSGGEPETLYTIDGIMKLVGVSKDDPDTVLIVAEDDDGVLSVGLLSLKGGQVRSVPYNRASREDRRMLSHIKGWERVYADATVYVRRQTKQGMGGRQQWTDVFVTQGNNDPINISKCDGINCGQPSLSWDGRQVVFVKED